MKFFAHGLWLSCLFLVSQSGLGSQITLPAGTVVSVKLSDAIDSARDPFGRQYAASVAAPVEVADGETIAAGSRATIVLVHNNSGWVTQLSTLTIKGRTLGVTSGAGTLAKAKVIPTAGIAQQMGLVRSSGPVSDDRLVLASATELRFRVIGSAIPVRYVASFPSSRRPARVSTVSTARTTFRAAIEREPGGIAYLCSAKDIPDRVSPTSYYIADVFETSDDPIVVELRWRRYLAATYPYRFANNAHAVIHCRRIDDVAAEREARQQLERESRLGNAAIVQTRWHYTLGPPPQLPAAAASADTK